MKISQIHPRLQEQFKTSFHWTLAGSITYETLKILHCFMLLKCMSTALYGSMGSIFSLVYLVTYIADLGATNSLPAFLSLCTQNQETFKEFLLKYSLLPHLPITVTCAVAATILAAAKFTNHPCLFIIPLLITMETVRSFLRLLLHTTFQAKHAVVVELCIIAGYIAAIWAPYLIWGVPLSLNHIFTMHLVDSTLTVSIFLFLVRTYYKTLPTTHQNPARLPNDLTKRLISTRLFNYMLRVSRNLFTSNFLTPLFAAKFGLAAAGLFYFSSMLANTIQAVIKSVIGYSGNALLANLKNSPYAAKREAFSLLFHKFMLVVTPIVIVVLINHQNIINLSSTKVQPSYTIALSLLFLLISFTEFFFILYEQFYIIEEAASKLFFSKVLELVCFYLVITSPLSASPVITLLGLIIIRFISFSIIAMNAYYWWKIKPNFAMNMRYVAAYIVIASLIAITWHHYF